MNSQHSDLPFGRSVLLTKSPHEILGLEQQLNKTELFTDVDTLLGSFLPRLIQGERVAELTFGRVKNSLVFPRLSPQETGIIENFYAVGAQQSRGAWYIPNDVPLRVGLVNLPYNFKTYAQFPTSIVIEDRGKLALADYPGTVFLWSIVDPLVGKLFLPFELRGPRTAIGTRAEQLQQWSDIAEFYEALGLRVTQELGRMSYGSGWHRLRALEQFAAKQQLLTTLAAQIVPETAKLYRAYRIRELLDNYYKKAKNGRILRRKVVTKAMEPILSGFFGGDWLAFLDYIGEEPHPDEQVATALPSPRFYATGASRVSEVAASLGISPQEAERIAATMWGGSGNQTPIERRVSVLTEFWSEFDDLHNRQSQGMQSLWGLVLDQPFVDIGESRSPYRPSLYETLLSNKLQQNIEQLWATTMLARWPEAIVTQPLPHLVLAEVYGSALTFWHGCALTAWFVTEDGFSRTDIPGLQRYYEKQLIELQGLGTPIDLDLFHQLIEADRRIGPGEIVYDDSNLIEAGSGISIEIKMSSGTKRKGFEVLRDIITKFRRRWSQQYLSVYLGRRWKDELLKVQKAYNIATQERGKPPTVKQFAPTAALATNHWFAGDISALYGAIGEKCTITPLKRRLMPNDATKFVKAVFVELQPWIKPAQDRPLNQNEYVVQRIAQMCLQYVQIYEALGRPPYSKEFTALNNEYYWSLLASDNETALQIFGEIIEATLQNQ